MTKTNYSEIPNSSFPILLIDFRHKSKVGKIIVYIVSITIHPFYDLAVLSETTLFLRLAVSSKFLVIALREL